MRIPRMTTRRWMIAVAAVAVAVASERLWQRSRFYRKQAALCAYFEQSFLWYAAQDHEGLSDDGFDFRKAELDEASRYRALKECYGRVSQCPWLSVPKGTPDSVNPWDLADLSAAEIEEMVAAPYDDSGP